MKKYLHEFLKEKPFFFSFLRPKEISLYQKFRPFKTPILDVGCGDGFFASLAFEKVDVGLDVRQSEIDEAKNWNVYKEVKEYNGKKIPYKDGYFSTVLCNSTFEHIPNMPEVLQESARVLKKGGMLYFTVPTDIWPQYLFWSIFLGDYYRNFFIKKSKHYNLYSFEEWEKKLSSLGLIVTDHTHYLDKKLIMWLFDISHYLSISSLVTKKLFNRWVLFPEKTKYLKSFKSWLIRQISPNTASGPYLFIAARKIK